MSVHCVGSPSLVLSALKACLASVKLCEPLYPLDTAAAQGPPSLAEQFTLGCRSMKALFTKQPKHLGCGPAIIMCSLVKKAKFG